MSDLVCWKCGAALGDEPLPVQRLAECRRCGAELHVCRMCEFYDTAVAEECRESGTDPPRDKDRANFCDYFQPSFGVAPPTPDTATDQDALAELARLFGDPTLKRRSGPDSREELSPEEYARRELNRLFGDKPRDG